VELADSYLAGQFGGGTIAGILALPPATRMRLAASVAAVVLEHACPDVTLKQGLIVDVMEAGASWPRAPAFVC
jgi:hypothetical protein